MRTRQAIVIALGFIAAWSYPHPAEAGPASSPQNPEPTQDTNPEPISVSVTPSLVAVFSGSDGKVSRKVIIAGDTLPIGNRQVAITIKAPPPNPPSVTVQWPLSDTKGHFIFDKYAPWKAGNYEVDVTAPDGRGKASAKFRVIEFKDVKEEAEEALAEADKAANNATQTVASKIDALAESPPKEELTKKLANAKRALRDMTDQSQNATVAMKAIVAAGMQVAQSMQVGGSFATLQLFQGDVDKISDAMTETERETDRIKALTAKVTAADIGCDDLAVETEMFNTISALLNVNRSFLDTVIGFAKDLDANVAGNVATGVTHGSSVTGFAAGEMTKNITNLTSADALVGNAYSIMADVGAFVTGTLFSEYCAQFVGPVEATMNAKFFTPSPIDGKPTLWWSYSFKLAGRLILYYPKSAKGDSIRLKGRIEGYAYDFKTWEDALNVMFPKLMGGTIQQKVNFPPIEMGPAAAQTLSQGANPFLSAYVEGSGPGLLGPNSFLLEIEGVLEKDSISILIGKAFSDFTANHRVAAQVLSPMTGGLGPQWTWYALPFKNAHHVFDTVADGKPLKMPIKMAGKAMVAQGNFTGTAGISKAHADYTVTLKACNPGC